jgi:DNA repair protein RecN (Recombination protein N)
LRDADQHRVLLDAAGGEAVASALAAYRTAYDSWRSARERLLELTRTSAERGLRITMLRGALEEISAVDAEEGEEDRLRTESERLTHAEELRSAAFLAHDALVGAEDPGQEQPSVTELLAAAAAGIGPAAAHDEELAALRSRLDEIAYLSSDLAADLASYGSAVEVDEERLAEVHQRRADLTALLRKYGGTTTAMLELARSFAAELGEIDVSEDDLGRLAATTEELRQQVGRTGTALTAARRRTAERVGLEVTRELAHLAMGSATVTIHVEPRAGQEGTGADTAVAPGGQPATGVPATGVPETGAPATDVPLPDGRSALPRRHGLDEVEIRLAANPGASARSVTKAASGGELSRVMLALELVCGDGTVPTYVFDEVDAGVGGSAALDLGARLARLGRGAQVIVVTHLGQVAAHADRHLVVRKSTDGQVTSSGVVAVEGEEREAEIARMLGGVADSDAALEHARELLSRRATMAE